MNIHEALQMTRLCVSSFASIPPLWAEHVRKRPINMMEVSQVPTLYVCPETELMLQSYQQSETSPKDRIRAMVRHDEISFPIVMTSPMLGVRLRNGNPDVVSY